MEKKYTISFFIASLSLIAALLFLVTWMNPSRITNAPWSIDFISDRNMPLKKFLLIQENKDFTDLIVGSSTSEVFVPQNLKSLYGIESYLGGIGGSKTPLRFAQIKLAVETNPNLKRILYTADLFEFVSTEIETNVYYQENIMREIPTDLRTKIKRPDWVSRVQDFISYSSVESSFKTLKDFKIFKSGKYQSQYLHDGTTSRSMVQFDHKEEILPRVMRIAKSYEGQYKNIDQLDPVIMEFYHEMIKLTERKGVQMVFIITPWHSGFYKHFEADFKKHNDIYNKWVEFIKSLKSPHVQVVDFSYPLSLKKGIGNEKEFWHDGIHFSPKTAEIMLNEVFREDQDKSNGSNL